MLQLLRLEYRCTAEEMREAQTLNLRKQVGRGSKWLTIIILLTVLLGLVLLLGYQLYTEVPALYRSCAFVVAIFLVFIIFFIRQRRARRRTPGTVTVVISDKEVSVASTTGNLTMPWSSFSACLESPNLFVLVDRQKSFLVVLPKRVFPSQSWEDWFRGRANDKPDLAEAYQMETVLTQPVPRGERVTLNLRLGFRDYLDCTFASWFARVVILGLGAGIPLGTGAYAATQPHPHAIYSTAQMFCFFVLPFALFMVAMLTFLITFRNWRAHAAYLVPQEVSFSDLSIDTSSRDGTSSLPWSTYTCYKETRRSFLLWSTRTSAWLLIPKRNIESADNLDRCRALLGRHVRQSPWYLG